VPIARGTRSKTDAVNPTAPEHWAVQTLALEILTAVGSTAASMRVLRRSAAIPVLALTAQCLRRRGDLRRRFLTECPVHRPPLTSSGAPQPAKPSLAKGVAAVLTPRVRGSKRGNFEKTPVSSMKIGVREGKEKSGSNPIGLWNFARGPLAAALAEHAIHSPSRSRH